MSRVDGVQVSLESDSTEDSKAGVVNLPVQVEDLRGVGTYTGILTVDGQELETEILVTDGPGWAVVAVAVGLIVGAVLLWLTRHFSPRFRLWLRAQWLDRKYDEAKKRFDDGLSVGRQNARARCRKLGRGLTGNGAL